MIANTQTTQTQTQPQSDIVQSGTARFGPQSDNDVAETVMDTTETTETAEAILTTKQQQATHIDSRNVAGTSAYIGETTSTLPPEIGMDVGQMTHLDVLKQREKIGTVIWTPGATGLLQSITFPNILKTLPTNMINLIRTYSYLKPSFTVKAVMNTTKFQAGKLFMFWDPLDAWIGNRTQSVYTASMMPFVELDAGDSNEGEIVIPYEYMSNYFSTITDNPTGASGPARQLGSIRVYVQMPLINQNGSTTPITVTLFMHTNAVDLRLPLQSHVPFSDYPARHIEQHGLAAISAGIKTASKAAEVAGGIADKVSKTVSTVTDVAKSFFNLSHPADIDSHNQNMLATVAPAAWMFGQDKAVRLATSAISHYTDTKFSVATSDETSITKIIQKPSLFNIINWTTAQTPGTVLLDIPVCPIDSYTGTGPFTVQPTWLSYFGYYHDQWSGDIIYRFNFASTQFNTGRLAVTYTPTDYIVPTDVSPDLSYSATQNPHVIFDLHEQKELIIRVSYNGTTETKQSVPACEIIAGATLDGEPYLYQTMGRLQIIVITPLNTIEGTVDNINFGCWVAGGSNFRYDFPSRRLGVSSTTTFARNIEQKGEVFDARGRSDPLHAVNILKSVGDQETRDRFQERVDDVRDLAKRPTLTGFNLTVTGSTFENIQPFGLNAHPMRVFTGYNPTVAGPSDSFMYNMADLYALWSGSIRFKVVPVVSRDDRLILKADAIPFQTTMQSLPITQGDYRGPLHIQNMSQDAGMEIEVPYISSFAQSLVHYDDNEVMYGAPMAAYISGTTNIPSTVNCYLLISAGDDIAFRSIVCPPVLSVSTVTP